MSSKHRVSSGEKWMGLFYFALGDFLNRSPSKLSSLPFLEFSRKKIVVPQWLLSPKKHHSYSRLSSIYPRFFHYFLF
jgi:hypothetical protein